MSGPISFLDATTYKEVSKVDPLPSAPFIDVFKPQDAVAINPAVAIWTPASGKKFRLMAYCLVSSVAGNILLKDGAGGTVIAVVPSAAGGPGTSVSLGKGILSAAANNVLQALGPATSTLSGIVMGIEE